MTAILPVVCPQVGCVMFTVANKLQIEKQVGSNFAQLSSPKTTILIDVLPKGFVAVSSLD
jgi:hypothetical protein